MRDRTTACINDREQIARDLWVILGKDADGWLIDASKMHCIQVLQSRSPGPGLDSDVRGDDAAAAPLFTCTTSNDVDVPLPHHARAPPFPLLPPRLLISLRHRPRLGADDRHRPERAAVLLRRGRQAGREDRGASCSFSISWCSY